MSNTLSREKTLAHIASIASKSKIEDSDVLFFKDGVYTVSYTHLTLPTSDLV